MEESWLARFGSSSSDGLPNNARLTNSRPTPQRLPSEQLYPQVARAAFYWVL